MIQRYLDKDNTTRTPRIRREHGRDKEDGRKRKIGGRTEGTIMVERLRASLRYAEWQHRRGRTTTVRSKVNKNLSFTTT